MKKHCDSNIEDGKKLLRIYQRLKNYGEFIDEGFKWEERMTTEKEGSWKDIFEKESRGLFEEHYRNIIGKETKKLEWILRRNIKKTRNFEDKSYSEKNREDIVHKEYKKI